MKNVFYLKYFKKGKKMTMTTHPKNFTIMTPIWFIYALVPNVFYVGIPLKFLYSLCVWDPLIIIYFKFTI